MESTGAGPAESGEALEAAAGLQAAGALANVAASVAVLGRIIGQDFSDRADGRDVASDRDSDPLRRRADACLDALAEYARFEARSAALKVQLAAEYIEASEAIASPAGTPQEHTAQEMSTIAEVACVLTVSERTAGALLSECHELTTALPLTLAALQSGSTTGITNLGQPSPKHHRLKHSTSWTPSQASKDKPPGWTAPSGRHNPSEQQDWQPPSSPDQIGRPGPNSDVGVDLELDQARPRDGGSGLPAARKPRARTPTC